MYMHNSRGLETFRKARERDRKKWERKQKAKEISPNASDGELDAIMVAHERQTKVRYVYPRNRFGRSYKVEVRYV